MQFVYIIGCVVFVLLYFIGDISQLILIHTAQMKTGRKIN